MTKDQVRTYFSSLSGTFPSKMFTINGRGNGSKTSVTMIAPSSSPQSSTNTTTSLPTVSTLPDNTNVSAEESIADNYVIGSDSAIMTQPQTEALPNTTSTTNSVSAAPTNAPQRTVTVTAASSGISTNDGSGTFVIEGKGNGHGGGMSQKGANGMAAQGYDFLSILHHYYTDVTIQ